MCWGKGTLNSKSRGKCYTCPNIGLPNTSLKRDSGVAITKNLALCERLSCCVGHVGMLHIYNLKLIINMQKLPGLQFHFCFLVLFSLPGIFYQMYPMIRWLFIVTLIWNGTITGKICLCLYFRNLSFVTNILCCPLLLLMSTIIIKW